MNKLLKWINALILKYHNCDKHLELYSVQQETFGTIKMITRVEQRCIICERKNEKTNMETKIKSSFS